MWAKPADAETLAELANMGKSPGPDERAVIVPFDFIAQFALREMPKAIEAEIATGRTESAI